MLGDLFLMIMEIPKSDFFTVASHQFVVFIVQLERHGTGRLELEQKLLRDQVVLVHHSLHRN